MVNFQMANQEAGKAEMLRGWYHSSAAAERPAAGRRAERVRHPGYGCWLSGIDVNTQMNQQQHNDPYLAVVVSTSVACAEYLLRHPDRPEQNSLGWQGRHWGVQDVSRGQIRHPTPKRITDLTAELQTTIWV